MLTLPFLNPVRRVQAPEVFKKVASTEADMWSLGMMMYFMVANRFPFW